MVLLLKNHVLLSLHISGYCVLPPSSCPTDLWTNHQQQWLSWSRQWPFFYKGTDLCSRKSCGGDRNFCLQFNNHLLQAKNIFCLNREHRVFTYLSRRPWQEHVDHNNTSLKMPLSSPPGPSHYNCPQPPSTWISLKMPPSFSSTSESKSQVLKIHFTANI